MLNRESSSTKDENYKENNTFSRPRKLTLIFSIQVSQMENKILRRMNLSSFLMVPVQRITKYPLLLARLLKVPFLPYCNAA